MADDHPQRPFGNPNLQSRATPTANDPAAAGNDPLAELARLIGQNDPFGEFGRSGGQPQAAPQPARQAARQPAAQPASYVEPAAPVPGYPPQAPAHDPYAAQPGDHQAALGGYAAEDVARQPYGGAPLGGSDDLYQPQGPVPGYEGYPGYDEQGAYQDAGYDPNMAYADDGQEYYDDIPPPRRRMGVLAIAAVFALAVVGTAGAFGYRALFGSGTSGPPPVIKADSTPSKIVPDKTKDQAAKLINDRVNDAGGDQKLVSREEQPVDLNQPKPAGVLTQGQSVASAGAMQAPAIGSGVIGSDPKKIHTITIRPDQPMTPGAGGEPQANMAAAMPPAAAPEPAAQPPLATQSTARQPVSRPAPAPRPTVTHRVAPAPQRVARAPIANAPLSLTPDAVASAPTTRAPTRLAPQASQAAAVASGSYAVQVSSRRSQADARAALQRAQSRYGSVLSGQRVMVRRVDLGAKGVYYRAMVGPFGSSDEATQLCSRLKAAGGSCFVQRI